VVDDNNLEAKFVAQSLSKCINTGVGLKSDAGLSQTGLACEEVLNGFILFGSFSKLSLSFLWQIALYLFTLLVTFFVLLVVQMAVDPCLSRSELVIGEAEEILGCLVSETVEQVNELFVLEAVRLNCI